MLRKALSLILSVVLLSAILSGMSSAYAATTSQDGVVMSDYSGTDVNRYIFYPEELKTASRKYPVIAWANGTGCQPTLYFDLFRGLARQGYIIIASSETMAADGKDQISSLNYIINKSKASGDELYNKVDVTKAIAMGHSQGGRSAVNAASADKRFCCVVSLAGSNYLDEAKKLKAPALFITGTSDSIVSSSKWVKPAYDACKGAAAYASLVGAKHTTCCSEPDKYIGYCVSWIKAWTENDFDSLSVFKSGGALSADTAWVDVASKNLTNNISGEIVLSPSEIAYSGKAKKPAVTVKDYRGAVISADNYTVSYASGRKNIGKYKVTVNYCNNYSGAATAYFLIVPKATAISKLTPTKAGFTAKWNKQANNTSGYQLQYSLNSKFTASKVITVSSNKTTSKTVSKLAKGKKYYVRVRAYKTVGKDKYYSSWSKVKTVTTKK